MKNALHNASIYIAGAFGIRIQSLELVKRLRMKPPALLEAIKPYAQPAVEMYEIGEEVAMGDANDKYAAFGTFGEWFGAFCYENNRLPEEPEALEQLSNCIFMAFTGQMTHEQDDRLRSRLAAEVKEYANE